MTSFKAPLSNAVQRSMRPKPRPSGKANQTKRASAGGKAVKTGKGMPDPTKQAVLGGAQGTQKQAYANAMNALKRNYRNSEIRANLDRDSVSGFMHVKNKTKRQNKRDRRGSD